MNNILITGATGSVGSAVIKSLFRTEHRLNVVAGLRNFEDAPEFFSKYRIGKRRFDFTDSKTYDAAFRECDILFLMRPPQLSEVKKIFKPLIQNAKQNRVKHIIFLSVQGVEKNKFIPHNKIEQLIVESKIPYTFLRPAYFMQNFITTLRNDLVFKNRVFLPAGNAKFTLIDVGDIGNVAAEILISITKHVNVSYELTCNEKLTFKEMAAQLSSGLDSNIQYVSPNLFEFYRVKKKEGLTVPFILVMIMLHYLPRFQKEPGITGLVQEITKKQPITFTEFVDRNKTTLHTS